MTRSKAERDFTRDRVDTDPGAAHGLTPDLSRVLIAGNSPVNRVVVSKIVERSGLTPVCETPPGAVRVLPLIFPGVVILDGGADNNECDGLVAGIIALRRVSSVRFPAVILLASRMGAAAGASLQGVTDAVIAKPFTTEQLQPAVERLLLRARA